MNTKNFKLQKGEKIYVQWGNGPAIALDISLKFNFNELKIHK